MPGDIDLLRTRLHAVENRVAPPDAIRRVHRFQMFFRSFVASIEGEAVTFQDRRRSQIVLVRPQRWAARRATGAHDALRRFHQQFRILMRLQPLHLRRRRLGDEIRLHHLILAEEIALIDRQILDDRQKGKRLDHDRLLRIDVLHQYGTRQTVAPVDPHPIRAAHAVRARPPKRQRPIDFPLDLMQRIENAESRIEIVERVVLEVRFLVLLRIISLNAKSSGHVQRKRQIERLDFNSLGRCFSA